MDFFVEALYCNAFSVSQKLFFCRIVQDIGVLIDNTVEFCLIIEVIALWVGWRKINDAGRLGRLWLARGGVGLM